MTGYGNIILIGIVGVMAVLCGYLLGARSSKNNDENIIKQLREEIRDSKQELANHTTDSIKNYGQLVGNYQMKMAQMQDKRLEEMNDTVEKHLSEMRNTVDRKLEQTLNRRINESFQMVNTRLEQVYRGLGEMQELAQGVGDIKKVLSNVKTRGILGEVQLKAILEEILTPTQYGENVATKRGSRDRVEFAIKMPGGVDGFVYLPVDSKFPGDAYSRLVDAFESGEKENIVQRKRQLEAVLRSEAKDISDKYIDPPHTTDFAIMFLPFEGLYAEAVRVGMVETLQRDFHVNIAGPTTFAALLNSLQMGFQTLAIEKRSSEVWEVLAGVKAEFAKFEDVLLKARERLRLADTDLEKLMGTRTNAINRKLKAVTEEDDE